jgi:hypothetical protein
LSPRINVMLSTTEIRFWMPTFSVMLQFVPCKFAHRGASTGIRSFAGLSVSHVYFLIGYCLQLSSKSWKNLNLGTVFNVTLYCPCSVEYFDSRTQLFSNACMDILFFKTHGNGSLDDSQQNYSSPV